ncbi:MAG: hypothetical protein SOW80_11465 [Anaerovoracaceae bacterium]|nr:hypothetical protein [Anaerovoracaceae bacterium]
MVGIKQQKIFLLYLIPDGNLTAQSGRPGRLMGKVVKGTVAVIEKICVAGLQRTGAGIALI